MHADVEVHVLASSTPVSCRLQSYQYQDAGRRRLGNCAPGCLCVREGNAARPRIEFVCRPNVQGVFGYIHGQQPSHQKEKGKQMEEIRKKQKGTGRLIT